MEQIFWKIKEVTSKTPLFVIGPFCICHSICLKIGFWQSSFEWKWCVFNLSGFNYKTVLQFFENFFVFQKICFQVKVLKTFETFTDCRIKTCRYLKWRAILKIPSTVFRRTYAPSVGFKVKTLRKSVFECEDKIQLKFCQKSYWKKQPFIFTAYLMNHVFQTSVP